MSLEILDYILPRPIAQEMKEMLESETLRDEVSETLERSVETFAQAGLIVGTALVPAAGLAGFGAARLFQETGEAFEGMFQDYTDFYDLIVETKGGVLLDFLEYLVSPDFSADFYDSMVEGVKKLLNLSPDDAQPLHYRMPSGEEVLRCVTTLATIALYPHIPNCFNPIPTLDVSNSDVNDLIDAAVLGISPVLDAIF